MYQSKEFEKLTQIFEETVIKLEENFTVLDTNILYKPNHACIWNDPKNIGLPCKVMVYNTKLALVKFIEPSDKLLSMLYRLEDLEPF